MPRSEGQPEVVQPATGFHDLISEPLFPVPTRVLNNPISLHPTDGMLDPNPNLGDSPVVLLVLAGQLLSTGFLLGLNDRDPCNGKTLKPSILEQCASIGQVISGFIRRPFVVFLALASLTQEEDAAWGVGDYDVLDRVAFFLPL